MSGKVVTLLPIPSENRANDFFQVMVDGVYVGIIYISSAGRWTALHQGVRVALPGRNPSMETALGALLVAALGYSIVDKEAGK